MRVIDFNKTVGNLPRRCFKSSRIVRSDNKGRFSTPIISSSVIVDYFIDDNGNEFLIVRKGGE